MRLTTLAVLLVVLAGCGPSATQKKLEQYFVDWLKDHGEKQVVVDSGGVGLAGNATRLKASIYGSKRHDGGHSVETEFRVKLPGGGEIVEFVAGMGDTHEAAIDDSLVNFTLSTYHVVYKCFLNDADPHQPLKKLTIGGVERDVAFGDLFVRGSAGEKHNLGELQPAIEQAIAGLSLGDGPHWIKIVYGQANGEVIVVAATLDNGDENALTETVRQMNWPKSETFYMAKQFIVIK